MADMTLDEYQEAVIKSGDEGSKYLAARAAPTLSYSPHVRVLKSGMNGLAVLDAPGSAVAVHSSGGDASICGSRSKDLSSYAYSAVVGAVHQAKAIGAKPLAIADVFDCSKDDTSVLEALMDGITAACTEYQIPIMNGEYAILGNRVVGPANVTVTMVSSLPPKTVPHGLFVKGEDQYAIFDPEGKPIFMNSDGVGTKTEMYERLYDLDGNTEEGALALARANSDFLAMNLDDGSKKGARARAISGTLETKGVLPVDAIRRNLAQRAAGMGVIGILQHESLDHRIAGFSATSLSYNISGTLVSTIDEGRLRNPLVPKAGEHLIAIQKREPNPRSNGITVKREKMVEWRGPSWHRTPEGVYYLEYLAEPSAVLYPLFSRLIDSGLATSVYHMSGGAFDGKLAVPLAAHGLGAKLQVFLPDPREQRLAALAGTVRAAYAKWPMGNDAFIATANPKAAIREIIAMGYNARDAGILQPGGGITFTGFDGSDVTFSGKK